MTRASTTNKNTTDARPMPKARKTPTSLVRSNTDISMVLSTPKAVMNTMEPASTP